jgi:endogenous inhibitor of DNA gyrase (YacG/DUF329 family)
MTDGDRDTKPLPLRPPRKCPLCGQPAARNTYPFCSRRCADIDLNRWLSGRYVIPAAQEDETAEDEDDGDHGKD